MSFSAARLTLYAVLSSIEDDLREFILQYLGSQRKPLKLLGEEIYQICIERIKKDDGNTDSVSLEETLYYLDFADAFHVLNTYHAELPVEVGQIVRTATQKLEKLAPIRNRVAHSRPLNYDDLAITLETAEELVSESSLWRNLADTLVRLKRDPSFVLSLQIPSYFSESERCKHNLPMPDFDETGFLGRKSQVEQLMKLAIGPYPVITVVGEGGIGKTALALKAAYDILDSVDCSFDAIVWTSSKVAQLTHREILSIQGAICDSLGVFRAVADELGAAVASDPMPEILDYMAQFRILLILDNLETVLDDRIRSFLESCPAAARL